MSEKTKISWADSTVNLWTVCAEVSAGCAHCYARELAARYGWGEGWGKGAERHKFKNGLKNLAALNRKPLVCDKCGMGYSQGVSCRAVCGTANCGGQLRRRRIFHGDLCDILDEQAPVEWLAEWMDGIWQADQCVHILCSKRWELFGERLECAQDWHFDHGDRNTCGWLHDWRKHGIAPKNIIGLLSVANQHDADRWIPGFLQVPLACRGLSIEPLLGQVDLVGKRNWLAQDTDEPNISWLIIGGESDQPGHPARPCNVEWIRSLVRQGQQAGCAVHVKQLGSRPYQGSIPELKASSTPWLTDAIKDKKGSDMAEWPEDLAGLRDWPNGF